MPRARDLGIPLEGTPGPMNAITDVQGVEVGHTTMFSGYGELEIGQGPVRTGVTAVLPRGKRYDPVFAGWHVLNGNGEITGLVWLEESGFLENPIAITTTHSVGTVRDAIVAWTIKHRVFDPTVPPIFWGLPVVSETFDGRLNDVNGFHVQPEQVFAALDGAESGPVEEGNVGGGTGMVCYEFKGGIGTSSRRVQVLDREYMLGVLVQANYGRREYFTVAGVPVGREIGDLRPVLNFHDPHPGSGSIVVIIATDAPLLPHQLKRLARRVPMGIARLGGFGNNTSGDIFLAFSTANSGAANRSERVEIAMLPNDQMDPLFDATVQATEESILNALVAAETMSGVNGNTVYALPHERLRAALKKYGRLVEQDRPDIWV